MDGASSQGAPSTSAPTADLAPAANGGGSAKKGQGDLVAAAMMRSPQPLVDIGINLTNDAFRKVRATLSLPTRGVRTCTKQLLQQRAMPLPSLHAQDRDEVLQRAAQANVQALVVTGTCVRTSQQARDICLESSPQFPHLYFTAGVHPHDAKTCDARCAPLSVD